MPSPHSYNPRDVRTLENKWAAADLGDKVAMRLNVAQLLKEGAGGSRGWSLDDQIDSIDAGGPLDQDNQGPVDVKGDLQLVRTLRGILVAGTLASRIVGPCRRCLELVEHDVTLEIEEEYIPSIDIETGATLPITDDDEPELIIDEHHILDITEVVKQYLVVASTSLGLCRPDCKGLCPMCGQNLNKGTCECRRDDIDPRLAKLADLLADRGSQHES